MFLGGSPLECVSESVNAGVPWLGEQAYAPAFMKLSI